MSGLFASALVAAREAAASQHYPQGALYVVATPIGNLADIGLRALHVLGLADVVACEDTRHTQALLRAYGIDKAPGQWLAVHQHNETQAAQAVLERLRQGHRVAYVSDAGTPAVSDPGARLAAAVQGAALPVVPLPGPSSVTALLSVAGAVAADDQPSAFVFAGFLPVKAGERNQALQAMAAEARTVLLLEAPHRVMALARSLAMLGSRRVTVGRELTKQFEEIVTLPAVDLAGWLDAAPQRQRGEFALLLHPQAAAPDNAEAVPAESARVLGLLLEELPLKSAVRLAADITHTPRNLLYSHALALKNSGKSANN